MNIPKKKNYEELESNPTMIPFRRDTSIQVVLDFLRRFAQFREALA